MGVIRTIALVVLGISFFVFVLFFGRIPALRNTPIATLHKFLFIKIPNGIVALDNMLTGGRVTGSMSRFGNYIMHDRHPTVVIFFLVLLGGAEFLYLPGAWPQMSTFQRCTAAIALFSPYFFLYKAVMADPGYITPENHAYHMSLYPYDYSIFYPGQMCSTCNFLKPPRSKHCSVCKKCIARLDHHCIFINGCVGYGNHHWFILLLLSTALLSAYGGLLGLNLMSTRIGALFPRWSPWPHWGMDWQRYLTLWGYGLQDNVGMGAVTLLALLCSPLVWGLLMYTLWLVYCGTTTNESLKWSEWKEDMDDGIAFKRRLPDDFRGDPRIDPGCPRWPLAPQQVLARTEDGQPPVGGPGDGPWDHIWKIKDVENLYDMGLKDNMADIFARDYSFGLAGEPQQPAVEEQGRQRKGVKPQA
ncbi:DHHC zinc finger protein [Plectosphaerella plurivora]|uniref:Palmitoyltransferase n=1 Tax=Plectosphaerella plurivora TaxID=936078 RepID=A0A9P8V7G6_9PEZI|nr:DHHC zinc finger protein [Plectosphaerella plurivora]